MRLIVHGQQAYGKSVLEAILDKGVDEVVAVYCAPDKEGRPLDPLKEFALEKGLPVHQPESYKNPEVWQQLASHDADLCVMAYVLLFVPEEALNVPKYGSIQYHPSLLPWHKGPSSINWPIIMGRKKTGLSIFWPDNGLDTGPILMQKEVEIGPDDTLGSIYFDSLFPLGVEAMIESIDLVRRLVPQGRRANRLEPGYRRGLQPHSRRQSAAGRLDHVQRQRSQDFRQPQGRRQR
jgi:methionyl-tRNA formyltransferase